MSSEASDRKVVISGIRGLSEADIVLFLESRRHCPKGGSVNEFVQMSEDEAVVIFEDSKVANQLDRHLILLDGTKISVEPYGEYQRRKRSQTASSTRQRSPDDDNCSRSKNRSSSLETSGNGNHESGSHRGSSKHALHSDKWSGKSKTSTHFNETQFKPSYAVSQSKTKEGLSRIDSCGSSRSEENVGRESSRSSSRSSSDNSSRERSRAGIKSYERRTQRKHGGSRKSRSSSREGSRADSKSHEGKFGSKHSGRRKSRSSSREGSPADSKSHGRKFGSKHSGRRHSSSSSNGSSERQIRGSRPETSNASTDRRNKSHTEASVGHSSKSEKPQKPPKPPKPTKPPTPPKPNPEITRTVEILQLPCEKLKLIKLIWDLDLALSSSCKCNVKFDEQTRSVILEGEVDAISTAKLLFYEMPLDFETQRVDITPQIQKLLSTAIGESWLTEDFRTLGIAAVVYIRDSTANLIARNKDTLTSADNLLKQIVSTQNISFDACHISFLQSPYWPQKVQAVEASGLVSVHTNYSAKNVELVGRASDVDACATEIRELLKKNGTKTNKIEHTIGVVRLLKKQESSIYKDIHQGASSSIQLEFCCQEGIVKVIGLLDDVSKAEDIIRNKYMKSICYDKHEISTPGLTMEMFRARRGKQRDMIDLLESRHNCVIEVRRGGGQRSSGRPQQQAESPSKTPSMGIEVISGSIVQFKADVLVNTIADEGLERGGVVLKQFLEAGAPKLQQDLQKLGIPKVFGTDVVATDAYGKLKARFIFHAAIRKYQNQDSIEKLHNLIKKCLEMAAQRKVSSIAFPALGSGRLAFTPEDVVECFVQAKQTTQTTIKIFIVAVDDHTHKEFKSHLSKALSDTVESGWFSGDEDQEQPSSANEASRSTPAKNVIVFHINTTNRRDLQLAKEGLIEGIGGMVEEVVINDDALADLDDATVALIRDLQTPEVAINLDRRNGVIKMKGDCRKVCELQGIIAAIILCLSGMDRYPKYWTNYSITDDPADKVGIKRVRINPTSMWHAEVAHLVMASWDQKKVGVGRDASGLGPHAIKIRNIFCIENPTQLEKYMAKRKQLSTEAALSKFSPVSGLRSEPGIVTMNLGLRHLYGTLDAAVNEVFLLHGTKKERIALIDTDGLDTRVCADETLFGVGSYCAESSTKANQYADSVGNRVGLGQPLYMYVCRVLLGKPYMCNDPKNVENFKRPPCKQKNCHKDKGCSHPPVGRFDSIIGTHRPNPQVNGRLPFREFVVFHPEQSYPDFLVEYERVKYP